MLEALACGKAIVSTRVSGACEMICQGKNGIIVDQHTPEAMAAAMEEGLQLPDAATVSLAVAQKYAIKNLRRDFLAAWPAIQMSDGQSAVGHAV